MGKLEIGRGGDDSAWGGGGGVEVGVVWWVEDTEQTEISWAIGPPCQTTRGSLGLTCPKKLSGLVIGMISPDSSTMLLC